MKDSLKILGFFALGLLAGLLEWLPRWIGSSDFTLWTLYLLLFLVGINVGADPRIGDAFKKNLKLTLLIPFGIILGSIGGGALVSLFLDSLSPLEGAAVAAGFGYYSLSSVLISQMHSADLGTIALLSNIIREVFTLTGSFWLVRHFGPLAPIAAAGATSMDTTLPVISKASGKTYVAFSIASGAVLTFVAPYLITLILASISQ